MELVQRCKNIYIFTLLFKIPFRWYRQCQHWVIVFPYFKSHQGQSVSDWWVLMVLLSKSHRIPYYWQRIPPPELELLMEDLGTSVLSLSRITPSPRIGTSHGGLGDFGFELTKNPPPPELELLMEDFAGDWCVENNRCIPRLVFAVTYLDRVGHVGTLCVFDSVE